MLSNTKQKTLCAALFVAFYLITAISSFAESITHIYDDLNRLHQTQYGNGTIITYDYDEVGNRTQRNNSVPGIASISHVPFGCGSVTKPAGDPNFATGSSPTYGFQANTGSRIVDIEVDGVSRGPITAYTFSNISINHTLAPFFSYPDGNADNSGESVDIADALLVLRANVGLTQLNAKSRARADVAPLVNGKPEPDGNVTIADSLVILRKVVGLATWTTTCGSAQQSKAVATIISDAQVASAAVNNTSSISLIPSGNGSYTIQGSSMSGVAGIQLTIAYDTTTLGSPSVSLGSLASGAVLSANTVTSPGSITIGIMTSSTFTGNGPLAVVNFATWSSTSIVPTLMKYDLVDTNGNTVVTYQSVLTISASTLPSGTVGTSYSQLLSASGGAPPYTWSIINGSLPAGLTLSSSSGFIGGTPTTAENRSFTVQVRDNAGTTTSAVRSILINANSGGSVTFQYGDGKAYYSSSYGWFTDWTPPSAVNATIVCKGAGGGGGGDNYNGDATGGNGAYSAVALTSTPSTFIVEAAGGNGGDEGGGNGSNGDKVTKTGYAMSRVSYRIYVGLGGFGAAGDGNNGYGYNSGSNFGGTLSVAGGALGGAGGYQGENGINGSVSITW